MDFQLFPFLLDIEHHYHRHQNHHHHHHTSPLSHFATNRLFDRNVISLIQSFKGFVLSPGLFSLDRLGIRQSIESFCIDSKTGCFWMATNQHLYIIAPNFQNIRRCISITKPHIIGFDSRNNGSIFVSTSSNNKQISIFDRQTVIVFDSNGIPFREFDISHSYNFVQIIYIQSLQQFAIMEYNYHMKTIQINMLSDHGRSVTSHLNSNACFDRLMPRMMFYDSQTDRFWIKMYNSQLIEWDVKSKYSQIYLIKNDDHRQLFTCIDQKNPNHTHQFELNKSHLHLLSSGTQYKFVPASTFVQTYPNARALVFMTTSSLRFDCLHENHCGNNCVFVVAADVFQNPLYNQNSYAELLSDVCNTHIY